MEHHYVHHVLRLPVNEWPDQVARSFADINPQIYVSMQGPSELGMSGKLSDWDRTDDLRRIEVPTLVIGARHDLFPRPHRIPAGPRLASTGTVGRRSRSQTPRLLGRDSLADRDVREAASAA
jgi:pimeloyl-ACP methyl ester carboxylesterase